MLEVVDDESEFLLRIAVHELETLFSQRSPDGLYALAGVFRELDEDAPSVPVVARATSVAGAFEAVHQRGRGTGSQAGFTRQDACRRGAQAVEDAENPEISQVDTEMGGCRFIECLHILLLAADLLPKSLYEIVLNYA